MKPVEQTRRDFLRMAGKGVLGAAALSAVPSMIAPVMAEGAEAPAWPWKYQPIDPNVVLEHGYKCFYTHGGCGAGAVAGILEPMAEKYGQPYNCLNPRVFADAAGGYGVGSLCGSLAGACAIFGLFCEQKDANALRDQLFGWYRQHAFPSYQPELQSINTVANSVQCVDSVGIYMKTVGCEMKDPRRKARCAAVTGEVASKAVELLNKHFGFQDEVVLTDGPAAEEAPLAENEFIGVGTSEIGGEVKVKVTMDGDKIAKIEVLSHNETAGISEPAFEKIPAAIIAAQSTEVDAISGATKTSDALIAAVNDALSKAKK